MKLEDFLQIDFPALLTIIFCAISCALLGSLLLLRRESMLSDSLSHAVLPGLTGAFLLSGSIAPIYMIGGALVSCLACVTFIIIITRSANIESSAAMGVVFTSLFALGLFLLEHKIGAQIHLDAHHALYGALEMSYWPNLTLKDLPADIPVLFIATSLIIALLILFYTQIRTILFDTKFAQINGLKEHLFEWPFFFLVATLIVLSFNAVGAILVIALFVCPPATARLFCNNFESQLMYSAIIGISTAITGYSLASWAPLWLGFQHSLNAGGMIATISGLVLFISILYKKYYKL